MKQEKSILRVGDILKKEKNYGCYERNKAGIFNRRACSF